MERIKRFLKEGTPYIMVLLLSFVVFMLIYHDDTFRNSKTVIRTNSNIVEGIFDGYILCQVCDLKQNLDSHHDCATSGHQHVFKITRILDNNGNYHEELLGKTYCYKNTEAELQLLGKFHGEYSRMKGRIYIDKELVAVESIRKINTAGKRFKSLREPWLIS